MLFRALSILLAIGVAGLFGQIPITVRAGDVAPVIVWSSVLRSAGPASHGPGNLLGHVSVICIFPNVSANAQMVSMWNELIARFTDQPVNFVWITAESQSTLEPWLLEHPVHGWLLLDAKEETARAYGIESAGSVIVDAKGRIAGFTFMAPDQRQIQAVLEGKAVAISGDANDTQMEDLMAGRVVRLDAEPHRMPAPEPKPDIPPSEDVHISPTHTQGTVASAGPDHWVQRGFDLKSVLSMVYEKEPSRIVMPASLDTGDRYDFVVVLPREEEPKQIARRVQKAIDQHFQCSATLENRLTDVYVMTALEGKTPAAKTDEESMGGGSMGWSGFEIEVPAGTPPTEEALRKAMSERFNGISGISNISATNSSMDDFRRALEEGLNRPIVDETNLKGTYDLAVHGNARTPEEFLQMLRDQLGLVLTPTQRNVEMLVVRAH